MKREQEQGEDPAPTTALKINLNRQLAEVEALRSIYGEEGEFELTTQEEAILESLSYLRMSENEKHGRKVECPRMGKHLSSIQIEPPMHAVNFSQSRILWRIKDDGDGISNSFYISFIINLLSTELGGRHVSVGFSMPHGYPEEEAVSVTVKCGGGVSRSEHEAINMGAREVACEHIGQEAVLQVLQKVQEIALRTSNKNVKYSSDKDDGSMSRVCKLLRIKRVLIWFHHIKSLQKRKSILEWGKELNLGGYCKPGFPGIIVIEGEKGSVDTYLKQLQNLRWQAMSIRGEEEEEVPHGKEIDEMRHFLTGVKEVDEHGMSELGRFCREANLEHLFLSALKISR